jgi:hypothetical protein
MIPASIISTNANTTTIAFSGSVQGTAVVSTGIGGPTSSSFALNAVSSSFASSALTASYALNAGPGTTAYGYITKTLDQTILANGTDITWNSIASNGNITLPSGSGTAPIRIPAGTWRITCTLGAGTFADTTAGLLEVSLVEASTNANIGVNQSLVLVPTTYTGTTSYVMPSPTIDRIVTTATPLSFKARVTNRSSNVTITGTYPNTIIITSL